MISLNVTTLTGNDTTESSVTLSNAVQMQYQGVNGYAILSSEVEDILLSLDGRNFSDEIVIPSLGNTTLYIQCADISGTYNDAIFYSYFDGSSVQEGYFDVTVTAGTPIVINYESLSFSLAPRQSTIQFNGSLVGNNNINVGQTINGQLLDYQFSYELEQIQKQGQRCVIQGASFANWLVHSLIHYSVQYHFRIQQLDWTRPTFLDHLQEISSAIGRNIIYYGANFTPKTNVNYYSKKGFTLNFYEWHSGSFASILNELIGWSSDIPSMVINMYIDNSGNIILVQRGYEAQTLTPANFASLPTLIHTIRRTEWANAQYQTITPKQISSSDAMQSGSIPYDGTIQWGQTTLTYTDGYLTQEVKGNVTSDYTYTDYSDGKRLTKKETLDTDENTYTLTEYNYEDSGTEVFLFEETVTVYDGQDDTGDILQKTLTRHVPIGSGWYGHATYDITGGTEVEESNSISQGMPGQKANQYMVDSMNDAINPNNPSTTPRRITIPLNSVAKARQTYPIADTQTLQNIGSALDYYEGREEITLQAEVVGDTHIYNYRDKIHYDGYDYYLVSNNVIKTYNKVRQNIVAVRWVS